MSHLRITRRFKEISPNGCFAERSFTAGSFAERLFCSGKSRHTPLSPNDSFASGDFANFKPFSLGRLVKLGRMVKSHESQMSFCPAGIERELRIELGLSPNLTKKHIRVWKKNQCKFFPKSVSRSSPPF